MLNWFNKIYHLSFYLMFLYPILGETLGASMMISWAILSAFNGMIYYKKIYLKDWRMIIPPVMLFLLIALKSWIDGSDAAGHYTERSLSLFVIPVAFVLSRTSPNKIDISKLFYLFSICTIGIVSYGITAAIVDLSQYIGTKAWPTAWYMFKDPSFFAYLRTRVEQFTTIHPTYASLYLGITSVFLSDRLLNSFTFKNYRRYIPTIAMLFYAIVLSAFLAARTPFIFTLIAIGFLAIKKLRSKKHIVIGLSAGIAMTFALIYFIPSLSQRFAEISFNVGNQVSNTENSFNLRQGIYQCSFEIIRENWLNGVGPGQLQEKLNTCYEKYPEELYKGKNYNTHNQYFDYWASLGIIGPIILLIGIIGAVITFHRNQYTLGVALLILCCGAMLTENILTRQNGIIPILFCIMLPLFTINKD